MIGLGAEVIDRDYFLDMLEQTIEKHTDLGSWQDFKWDYTPQG